MFVGTYARLYWLRRLAATSLKISGISPSKFGNHAKVVIADDAAFYIGSQNLYPANLAEYGFIVDDAGVAADFVTHYFSDIWAASKRSAVSGPGAATCVLSP